MKVYPVFLHRAKHAAKEGQKPWVSAGTGGYSEAVSGKCPGFHAATWLEIG